MVGGSPRAPTDRGTVALEFLTVESHHECAGMRSDALPIAPSGPSTSVRTLTVAEATNEAIALIEAGREAEATALRDAVLKASPAYWFFEQGRLEARRGELAKATDSAARAIQADARFFAAYSDLDIRLREGGRIDEAIDACRAALMIEPTLPILHRNLLQNLTYVADLSAEQLFAEHLASAAQFEPPSDGVLAPAPPDGDAGRKLRIGVLSSDFRAHPVGQNLMGLFEHRDGAGDDTLICYAEVDEPDNFTELFRARCDGWRSTVGLTDRAVADMIRADGIDLLVLVAGHFDRNRYLVARYKPAAVQVSFLDATTSGLRSIDYWTGDPIVTPVGGAERFTETIVHLPHLFNFPRLIRGIPDVTPPPAGANGFITFGSVARAVKIDRSTVALWSEVLRAVPASRFAIRDKLGDPGLQARLRTMFAAHGIAPDRVDFLPPSLDYWSSYAAIDIALDTVTFAGCTTVFDALLMGLPVVALPGETVVSRLSASVLTTAGIDEFIADSRPDYVARARQLAENVGRLTECRATQRARVQQSPLCDGASYARSMRDLWRSLWRAHSARASC